MSTAPVIYYVGYLAIERGEDEDLDKHAARLMERADAGEVIVCQRRLGVGRYEYLVRVKS